MSNLTVSLKVGDTTPELLKQAKIENANNELIWHVENLQENESAVLSLQNISFDDMFPLDIKFTEDYSLIGLEVSQAPVDSKTGENMSIKLSQKLKDDNYSIVAE